MLRRAGGTTTAFVALAIAFAAPSANAGIVQSESVLPPGESGFVPVTGLADGSGSPHLYDQQQPFIDFARKNAMLGLPAAETEEPKPGIAIKRDGFGVPAITAGNDA